MTPSPLLRLIDVTRTFGGLLALDRVSLDVDAGDVLALVGDNGAGKSTLVKTIAGAQRPTSGELLLDGEVVDIASPTHAQRLGIETVYQDLALVGSFTVAENFFLGRERARGRGPGLTRFLRRREMIAAAAHGLEELHISIPGLRTAPVERMSGGQRQAVAIARGAFWGRRMLLLDEPTAALGVQESEQVLGLIRNLSARGLTIVMVTHNLEHLWKVCNRVVVMRRGRKVADLSVGETDPEHVVGCITGARVPV